MDTWMFTGHSFQLFWVFLLYPPTSWTVWLWAEFLVESNFSSESWRHCSTRVTRVTTGEAEAIRFSFPYGLRFLWERVGSHCPVLRLHSAVLRDGPFSFTGLAFSLGERPFRNGEFPWTFLWMFSSFAFFVLFLLYYRILLGWLGLPGWFHNVLTIFYFLSPCLLRDFSNLMFQAFCSIFAASMLFWVVLLFFFNHLKFFSNFMDELSEVINSL